ncbi:MAG: hypothetical protein KTR26_18080 [Flammeovirgaceae bacterium]|nr:hypothetical protein [Flammeovirgaceae bacterium]
MKKTIFGSNLEFVIYIPNSIKRDHVSFDVPEDITYFKLDKKEPISAYMITETNRDKVA